MVLDDGYMVGCAQMQIPEHVAGRKAGDQEFLRVVTGGVATKTGIAGGGYLRLARGNNRMIAPVAPVRFGAFTVIAGPIHADLVGVVLHEKLLAASLWPLAKTFNDPLLGFGSA